jgi:hypothetical protein
MRAVRWIASRFDKLVRWAIYNSAEEKFDTYERILDECIEGWLLGWEFKQGKVRQQISNENRRIRKE